MIAIGCDHAGFRLKSAIIQYLKENNISYIDKGCHDETSIDYPNIARDVALSISKGESEKGILICGTGIGMSIAANKIKGIRAALCHDIYSAKMTRAHNDSNILTMGQRVIGEGLAIEIVSTWLFTEFIGAQHTRRVQQIGAMEERDMLGGQ